MRSGSTLLLARISSSILTRHCTVWLCCLCECCQIFGCVLCAFGSYALNSGAGILAGSTLPKGVIALGVFILLLSLFGCLASILEKRILLSVYFGILFLLALATLLVGIGIYVEQNQSSTLIVQGWTQSSQTVRASVQDAFGCCGLTSLTDAVTPCPTGSQGIYCLDVVNASFQKYFVQAGAACIAFAVLMVKSSTAIRDNTLLQSQPFLAYCVLIYWLRARGFGQLFVCILMQGIKHKQYLETLREMHRQIREAKEDSAIDLSKIKTGLENPLPLSKARARASGRHFPRPDLNKPDLDSDNDNDNDNDHDNEEEALDDERQGEEQEETNTNEAGREGQVRNKQRIANNPSSSSSSSSSAATARANTAGVAHAVVRGRQGNETRTQSHRQPGERRDDDEDDNDHEDYDEDETENEMEVD